MTTPPPIEPLEAMPLPDGAVLLSESATATASGDWRRHVRQLALATLRQAMAERQLKLPLGPELEADDPERLLALNRFALQLAITGLSSDQVEVGTGFWRLASKAPQLLLTACVDEDNNIVHFPGVLTGEEFIAMASSTPEFDGTIPLDLDCFRGGIDRLFSLVQLLEPAALPRLALTSTAAALKPVVAVIDWLSGQLADSLSGLGGTLQPATAFAFRSGVTAAEGALTVLSIPLGLAGVGVLVYGEAVAGCIERFQLQLIPSGSTTPERLRLRLIGALAGDLLPDGLTLTAVQGGHQQTITSQLSTILELELQGAQDLIEVSLNAPSGEPLQLPPLRLPA